ncbi:hypothetical protein QR77_22205 [Streptomyces sp. 150FB]|uniref:hypothetical protein n=1 Tax=Streptomyces sp. 150FB TaxID=1576605 RepID=UPI00058906C3|nr:hypothetical protein [Streptomyces sp. 150FB]KIF75868.1 hypothetical protein QR77_22205 [Streptomyces sp. 150FB]
MLKAQSRQITEAELATQVEAMLETAEPDGSFRNTTECAALLLFAGAVLLAPPSPKPKKS